MQYSRRTPVEELKLAANAGNADAMYWLGFDYYNGEGVEEDEKIAKEYFLKAIGLGHEQAKIDFENYFEEDDFENDILIKDIEQKYPLKKLFDLYDSIIAIDTETSGLDPEYNRVIELAAVKLKLQNKEPIIVDQMDEFIKLPNGTHLDAKITELTGITEYQLINEGLDSYTVFKRFVEMYKGGNTLIVAYNAQFDISFLYYSLVREGLYARDTFFDKLDALTVFKDRHDYPHRLENAITRYGLDGIVTNSHRAIDDTLALVEVLKSMDVEEDDLDKYINLFGYHTKYGVNGKKLSTVTYVPQPYEHLYKLYEKQ